MNYHEAKEKKALIFGGTGLVGKYLIPKLLESGRLVTVVTRNPKRHSPQNNLRYRYADLGDPNWTDVIDIDFSEYSEIFFLAYSTDATPEYNRNVTTRSLEVLIQKLQGEVSASLNHLLYTGSTCVFGEKTAEMVNERSQRVRDTEYATNKIDAVNSLKAAESSHFKISILHPTGVYSETSKRIKLYQTLLKEGYFPHVRELDGLNNIVHAQDVAQALIQCATRVEGTSFEEYIINGEVIPYWEWFEMIEKGIPGPLKPKATSVLRFLYRSIIARLLRHFFRLPIVVPRYKMDLYHRKSIFSATLAQTHFNYVPTKYFVEVMSQSTVGQSESVAKSMVKE